MNTDDLVGQLTSAGVDEASIVRFDQKATPRHLRYLDLLRVWRWGLMPLSSRTGSHRSMW